MEKGELNSIPLQSADIVAYRSRIFYLPQGKRLEKGTMIERKTKRGERKEKGKREKKERLTRSGGRSAGREAGALTRRDERRSSEYE